MPIKTKQTTTTETNTTTTKTHSKNFETIRRTTDIKLFKKLTVGLSQDELDEIQTYYVGKKTNARTHVNLLKGWFINGRVSDAVHEKLVLKFPSVSGHGFKTQETTRTGKQRDVWINPDALTRKSPDADLQLVKVLQGSTMPDTLKKRLIEADENKRQSRTRALFIGKSNVTDIEKKNALDEYEAECEKFNTVVCDIEKHTGIISDVSTAAEKLQVIIRKDIDGRCNRHESVSAGCVERLKWIDSIIAYRDRDQAYADFITTCKKLGIDYEILRSASVTMPKRTIKALAYGKKSKQYLATVQKNTTAKKEKPATAATTA
jgi:hypothetical protein